MNYYEQIKGLFISNEVYKKIKEMNNLFIINSIHFFYLQILDKFLFINF